MQETASTTPKELEVKLEVGPTSLPALNKIPLFRTLKAAPTRSAEVSVYFDTDKQKLRKKGLMLRVRRERGVAISKRLRPPATPGCLSVTNGKLRLPGRSRI